MEEFVYDEKKYIKRRDLNDFVDLMNKYDFMLDSIDDQIEFNITFQYLINLTKKAPLFLQPYEYVLFMIDLSEYDEDLETLKNDMEKRLFEACKSIAKKESIFEKQVLWSWHENRPLIRGFYNHANKLWEQGKINQAHELFVKILKTNKNDNIGARYAVKATKEKMPYDEFEYRFVLEDETGSYYRHEELTNWFEE